MMASVPRLWAREEERWLPLFEALAPGKRAQICALLNLDAQLCSNAILLIEHMFNQEKVTPEEDCEQIKALFVDLELRGVVRSNLWVCSSLRLRSHQIALLFLFLMCSIFPSSRSSSR